MFEDRHSAGLEMESYPGAARAGDHQSGQQFRHPWFRRARIGSDIGIGRGLSDVSLCLMYADDGHGIAPALLDRVFDPFYHPDGLRAAAGLATSCSTW